MDSKNKNINVKAIIYLYFVISVIEVFSEAFSIKPLILITKPLIPLLLMILFYFTTIAKCSLFYIIMFFSLITNLLFIPNSEKSLFYGVIAYTTHRIFLLILIFKIIKIKDFIPFILATIPLGFIFFYLFTAADIPENSYYLVIFHNVLAAVLGGTAISSYIMNDSKENSFLMISVLLFLGLQLVIYIEKYYLVVEHTTLLRPLAMTLNVLAFYMFYKFVMLSEKKLNNN